MGEHGLPLAGKVAIVTGGAHGIGLSTVRSLLAKGARVAVGGRRAGDDATKERFAADVGQDVLVRTDVFLGALDVRSEDSVTSFVAMAEDRLGSVDILVNCAGISLHQTVCGHEEADWQAVIDVNLSGTFRTIRACLPGMIERKHGRIVNVASTAARVSVVDSAAYSASKAGVVALSKAVAVEGAPHGVACMSVSPTWVETDMLQASAAEEAEKTGRTLEDVIVELRKSNPQNRLVQPAEVADLITYLCGESSVALTMEDIQINAAALW